MIGKVVAESILVRHLDSRAISNQAPMWCEISHFDQLIR